MVASVVSDEVAVFGKEVALCHLREQKKLLAHSLPALLQSYHQERVQYNRRGEGKNLYHPLHFGVWTTVIAIN